MNSYIFEVKTLKYKTKDELIQLIYLLQNYDRFTHHFKVLFFFQFIIC